jgi:hypothetical protein
VVAAGSATAIQPGRFLCAPISGTIIWKIGHHEGEDQGEMSEFYDHGFLL